MLVHGWIVVKKSNTSHTLKPYREWVAFRSMAFKVFSTREAARKEAKSLSARERYTVKSIILGEDYQRKP